MNLYRFHFAGGSTISFACTPAGALPTAAMFARWTQRELVAIVELRPITPELELA